MRSIALALVVALVGCSEPHPKPLATGAPTGDPNAGLPTGTPGGTGTTYDPACADGVLATSPVDGAVNAFYLTDITFLLDAPPVGDEQIVLGDGAVALPGAMAYGDDRVVFTPTDPLLADTAYTAEIANCPPSRFAFRTSIAGAPIVPSDAIGTTYAVDVGSGVWIQPAGVGALLAGYLAIDILVGVADADATTLTMIAGVSDEGLPSQDLCAETVIFPPAAFDQNPYFELGPQDLSMLVMGAQLTLFDVHLSGAFRPDFSGIQGAGLVGAMDTRGLVPILAPGYGDAAVCDLLITFGVPCTICPDGQPYCVAAEVEDLAVPRTVGPLVPRSAFDIANDPSCP